MRKIIALLLFGLLSKCACSTVTYEGGGTHIIGYRIMDTIDIDRYTPLAQTHVILESGGRVDRDVYCSGLSRFTLNGGTIDGYLRNMGNSIGIINSGTIGRLIPSHESTVEIKNVDVEELLLTWDQSQVIINGGVYGSADLGSWNRGIMATANTQITIQGGSFKGLHAGNRDNGPYDMSTITLVGSNFALNGIELGKGRYYRSDFVPDSLGKIGILTGNLANGEFMSCDAYIYDGACIELIPEPCTLSLLAFGGLLLRRRRA